MERSVITLQELSDYLRKLYESPISGDYCENGLQFEGKKQIKKAATAVTASLATIEAAAEAGADALITHHGLFWKGESTNIVGVKKKRLEILFRHNISLFGFHLPMDAQQEIGNNWRAARDLGWNNLEPFGLMNGVPIGVKGNFAAKSRQSFQKELEKYYDHSATTAFGGKETIQSAALISGGAYRSLSDAAKENIDSFITGNFDEPAWHMALEEGINFYAMGHAATEKIGPRALAEKLSKIVPTQFLDIENPF